VIQAVIKKVARDMVNFMVKNSTIIQDTDWQKELKSPKNKEFYNWLDEVIQNHYKHMRWV